MDRDDRIKKPKLETPWRARLAWLRGRSVRYRLLVISIAGIFALTLLVCALGLSLTISWHENVEALLLEAEKRAAEHEARALESALEADERAALLRLVALAQESDGTTDPAPLADLPAFRYPFWISRKGDVESPALRGARARDLVERDVLPAEVEAALRFASSSASFADRAGALERLASSEALGTPWRVRCALRLARLHQAAGDSNRAAALYAQLIDEESGWLEESDVPPYLFVRLAHLEALASAGDRERVLELAEEIAKRIEAGEVEVGLAEEEFFLTRSATLFDKHGIAAPPSFAPWQREVELRRRALIDAENLRDWLLRLPEVAPATSPQHYFIRAGDAVVPIVWAAVAGESSQPSPLAVGFQLDLEKLEDDFRARLRSRPAAGTPLTFDLFSRDREDAGAYVPLASLTGDLHFLGIGIPRTEWLERVREARRPFVLAAVSIASTGFVVLAGLLLLYRGVRREFLLSRMKTEFVANVSHELKTPLALIRLCGETMLLERLRDASQRRKYLEIITRESVRLGHLITNMLEFSSIETGRRTYALEERDLAPVIREVLEAYRVHLDESKFTYEWKIPPSLPPVLADDAAVAQALINLLQNAVRYSPRTKHVEVKAEAHDDEIRISVKDAGEGIAPEEQARIWDDYYRTGTARARTRGSGLGLSVVRHVMLGHRGRTELESQPCEGSTFTLVFPRAGSANDRTAEHADRRETGEASGNARREGAASTSHEDERS